MKWLCLTFLIGCAPQPAYSLANGAKVYELDNVTLSDYRIDAAVVITVGIAVDRNDVYAVDLDHLGIFIRAGDHFECGLGDVVGCSSPEGIAIAAQSAFVCPYFIAAHELGHWLREQATNDPDYNHGDPEIFGPSGFVESADIALTGLCEYIDGAWL